MNFDVIIIGGGAAGLSAGLWCDDLGLNALLLESEKEFGGQLLWTHNAIENHLGIKAKNGRELRDVFLKQISNRNFVKHLQTEVKDIDVEKKEVFLSNGESFSAKYLVIATGIRRRKLNIEGEDDFEDKGMLVSGKRDKDSVKNKNVVIAGGGDAALENALILSETAKKIILVHRRNEFRARDEFIEQVQNLGNVEVLFDTAFTKISGNQGIEAVEVKNLKTDKQQNLSVDAVLIRIGVEPNTDFLRGKIDLDISGYIKIDNLCETNVKRIFAIGDVANPSAPTVSSAVGMGATAVKTISFLLKS
jgi:thioredoxin reductase (NADPH)